MDNAESKTVTCYFKLRRFEDPPQCCCEHCGKVFTEGPYFITVQLKEDRTEKYLGGYVIGAGRTGRATCCGEEFECYLLFPTEEAAELYIKNGLNESIDILRPRLIPVSDDFPGLW